MKTNQASLESTPIDPNRSAPLLVVEDDAGLLKILTEGLHEAGFEVVGATAAAEAVEQVQKQTFSLVLLDWDLSRGQRRPDDPVTGATVLTACRERSPLMPVIVMSGQQAIDARTDALMAEADSFLAKPFNLALMIRHLRHWLARTRTTASGGSPLNAAEILPFEEMKRRYVLNAVQATGGKVVEAARRLRLHRQTVAAIVKAAAEAESTNSES